MTRPNLLRLAVVSTALTFALPLASYANTPGPTPAHPATPSDTLSKLEKGKTERSTSAPKKKLKTRSTTSAPTTRSEFVPDQPWETEFYVENDISGRRAIQLALATFSPRR
ncbi:MAG: hypothetical protein ABI229_10955 [Gemmatimonadaceae bacterium]